jgi:hypothetical protein
MAILGPRAAHAAAGKTRFDGELRSENRLIFHLVVPINYSAMAV